MGPCFCGDTHCWSCGPAQGNWKCPICRAWADDGCEHICDRCDGTGDTCGFPPTGEPHDQCPWCKGRGLLLAFHAQADELARQEAEAESKLAIELEEADRLAEEYGKTHDREN